MPRTKKEATPYKSLNDKIAEWESRKVRLTAELNEAPEEQKASIQAQIAEADRKVKWYNGRLTNPRFAAKAQTESAKASTSNEPTVTSTASEPVVHPTKAASVVNES